MWGSWMLPAVAVTFVAAAGCDSSGGGVTSSPLPSATPSPGVTQSARASASISASGAPAPKKPDKPRNVLLGPGELRLSPQKEADGESDGGQRVSGAHGILRLVDASRRRASRRDAAVGEV